MKSARLEADLYALTHRGNPGDVAFYDRLCGKSARVLELGSGYGRLTSRLARPGRELVGLELDPGMLAAGNRRVRELSEAERRGTRLVLGDMRHFEFGARFDFVILPYNGLFCLLTKRDALACFRAVRKAVKVGGTFAFDVWNAETFHREPASGTTEDDAEPVVTLRHAGYTWDVFEQSRIGRAPQRLDVAYDYVPREGAQTLRIPIAQRYYRDAELTPLLERAGFAVVRRYGDFRGKRFTLRSPHLVILARAV